jgi:putative heme transporter
MTTPTSDPATTTSRWRRILGVVAPLVLVVGLLVGVLPAMADFSEVWAAISSLTWLETASLLLAAAWNILTYQFIILAALPGLTLLRAFVVG